MRYISNDTPNPMYVAGRLIPPFDGRHFHDHELPPEHAPAPAVAAAAATPSLDEQLREILKGTLKEIQPQLAGLTFEALERLAALDAASEQPRKTLQSLIDEEKLRRADETLRQEQEAERARALEEANELLQSAQAALAALPVTASDEERAAAQAAVDEAAARVDALTPEE